MSQFEVPVAASLINIKTRRKISANYTVFIEGIKMHTNNTILIAKV